MPGFFSKVPDRQTSQEEENQEEHQEDEVELRNDDLKDDKEMKLAKTDEYGFIHKSIPKRQEAKQLLGFKNKFFRSAGAQGQTAIYRGIVICDRFDSIAKTSVSKYHCIYD